MNNAYNFREKEKTKQLRLEIINVFKNSQTKLTYSAYFFTKRNSNTLVSSQASLDLIRRVLNQLTEEKMLYKVKSKGNKCFFCLRSWGSEKKCRDNVIKYQASIQKDKFTVDIDPSILSWKLPDKLPELPYELSEGTYYE